MDYSGLAILRQGPIEVEVHCQMTGDDGASFGTFICRSDGRDVCRGSADLTIETEPAIAVDIIWTNAHVERRQLDGEPIRRGLFKCSDAGVV